MLRVSRLLTAGVLSAALLGSCTNHGGNSYLLLTKAILPTATVDATAGTVTCRLDAGSVEILSPPFEPSIQFNIGLVIQNKLSVAPNVPQASLPNYDFLAEKVVVTYEAVGGTLGAVPSDERTNWATGTVPSGGSAAVYAQIIPPNTFPTARVGARVRAHIYVLGHLVSGAAAQTSDYEMIIEVGAAGSAQICTQL
jgi:hypothetical protein